MAADMCPQAVAARLAQACRLSAQPIVVPDRSVPTPSQVQARLREATALWMLCDSLRRSGPQR